MIRTVIVDDEPLARDGIRLRLAGARDLDVIGEAADGAAAVTLIRDELPDLVFLDVQMPGMSGFDVLAAIAGHHLPVIVFVTAYDQYAIRAFDVHAVDYLLKPFTKERFDEALRRARRELAHREEDGGTSRVADLVSDPLTRLVVKNRDHYVLLKTEEIDWMEAAANYVEVHAHGKAFLVRATISGLEQKLDPRRFTRIHRSVIVNVDRVTQIRSDAHGDYDVLLRTGKVLRMTRNYSSRLLG
ncbi:MAG TPA: response regulator [Thermoanaerobaculia bacterium]|nr:response regulator [Thermoanaerobaculia bacterium]